MCHNRSVKTQWTSIAAVFTSLFPVSTLDFEPSQILDP